MSGFTTPTRAELQDALIAAGCHIELDAALASPAVSRLLQLTVEVRRRRARASADAVTIASWNTWAARLRRLVGELDHQALRAGTDE